MATDELNTLATAWFCLSELKKNTLSASEAIEVDARQTEVMRQLVPVLKQRNALKETPFETYLDGDIFVNVWLNGSDEIEDSGYYCRSAF